MLVLQGTLRATTTLEERTDKKTGDVIPQRDVVQLEILDQRGLVQVETITVPDAKPFADKIGQKVNLPVRAWAPGTQVRFMYAGK